MECKHTEEEIIDFILKKLPDDRSYQLNEHIAGCSECLSIHDEWKEVLDMEYVEPSVHLKKRLLKDVRKQRKKRVWKRPGTLTAATMITIIAGIIVPTLMSPINQRDGNGPDISATWETPQVFLNDDGMALYEVEQNHNQDMTGYVWLNPQTKELYLFMEGLEPINDRDYQVWIKTPQQTKDAGVIRLIHDKGQLYFRSHTLDEMEYMMVSIEPKGGSAEPTREESFLLWLKESK